MLFVVLWLYTRKPRPVMATSGLFLIVYGVGGFLVEFVREPDQQMGYLALGWVTMGQVLSAPMIIAGAVLLVLAYRRGSGGVGCGSTSISCGPSKSAARAKATARAPAR